MSEKLPLDPKAELLTWGPVPMKSVLAYADCFKGLFTDFPKLFPGYSWPKALIMTNQDRLVWLHEAAEIQNHGGKLFLERMLPQDLREEARGEWRQRCEDLRAIEFAIANAALERYSDDDFLALWKKFHERVDAFWAHSSLPELSNYGSAEMLQTHLEACISKGDIAGAMETLTSPTGISFYQEEEIDLAETEDLEAHQGKYFWLRNSYTNVEVLPVSFFAERKIEFPRDMRDKVRSRLDEVMQKKKEVQARYVLPEKTMRIADAIADGIVWQDARKKEIWIYMHYEDLLLREIARRTDIPKEQIKLLTSHEAARFLEGALTTEEYLDRANGVAFVIDSGGVIGIDGAEAARRYWNLYVNAAEARNVSEFKGVVASKGTGTVRGKVRIVLDPYKTGLELGEILVTTMTSPEFVFLMKKAGAIVTDTGGLTSHAAIVSRELNVACIVGTKIATQVLKDGDMVEVDAEKGIVRKLY